MDIEFEEINFENLCLFYKPELDYIQQHKKCPPDMTNAERAKLRRYGLISYHKDNNVNPKRYYVEEKALNFLWKTQQKERVRV